MMVGFILDSAGGNKIVTCPGFDVGNTTTWSNCTTRATSSNPFSGSPVSSYQYELTAIGNVYTAKWTNGASGQVTFSWTDSGGIVPIGTGQREAVIAVTASGDPLDNFEMWDI